MKRIQYHHYGGPEVMRLEDFEPARPVPARCWSVCRQRQRTRMTGRSATAR